jgi:hypothetical protein
MFGALGDDHGLLRRFVGGPVSLDHLCLSAADEVAAAELRDRRCGADAVVLPSFGIEDFDLRDEVGADRRAPWTMDRAWTAICSAKANRPVVGCGCDGRGN